MLILSLLIYLILSLIFTQRLYFKVTLARWMISFFTIMVCINVLTVEILHFLRGVDNPWLFLLVQIILSGSTALFLMDPKRRIFPQKLTPIKFELQKWGAADSVLVILIGIVIAGVAIIGSLIPINNLDSMHTHLGRIFYWLQHGSLQSWYTLTTTQISYPINISIQGLWIFLLGGSERLFFLIPWLGLVVTVCLIYEVALLLGANRRGALVAGLISLAFPVVLLQSFSFQGDVFTGTLVLLTAFFLLLYSREKADVFLYLSSLAIILGIGSKQTALLFIPIYLLTFVFLLVKKLVSRRVLLITAGLSLLFFGLFSSFKFIQNATEENIPNASMVSPNYYNYLVTLGERPVEGYITNGLRYFYQSVSLDGLTGKAKIRAIDLKNDAFRFFTKLINVDLEVRDYLPVDEGEVFSYENIYPVNEDASWFGPLSYPILIAASVIVLCKKERLPKKYLFLSILLLLIFIFGQVILKGRGWGPNRGRHMIIPVLAMMPLAGFIISPKRILSGVTAAVVAVFSLYLAASILLMNDSRPLLTTNSLTAFQANIVDKIEVTNILNSQYRQALHEISSDLMLTSPPRTDILHNSYYENLFFQSAKQVQDIELINNSVPEKSPVYLFAGRTVLEYALFGINRTRELYQVRSLSDIPTGGYAIVSNALKPADVTGFNLLAANENFTIFYRP